MTVLSQNVFAKNYVFMCVRGTQFIKTKRQQRKYLFDVLFRLLPICWFSSVAYLPHSEERYHPLLELFLLCNISTVFFLFTVCQENILGATERSEVNRLKIQQLLEKLSVLLKIQNH